MTRFIKPKKSKEFKRQQFLEQHFQEKIQAIPEDQWPGRLTEGLQQIQKMLGNSNDLVRREFFLDTAESRRAAVVYIDGLVTSQVIDDQILRSLMLFLRQGAVHPEFQPSETAQFIQKHALPIGEVKATRLYKDIIKNVLTGDTALLFDGCQEALLLNTKGFEKRGVEEPRSESVVRGPRDAFSETLRTNTALLRRRIKDPDLRVVNYTVGERSNTDVVVVYIEGVADPGVLSEIERRITDIQIDGIFEGGYIEQFIEDSHWSPFPLIQNTERPDKAAANLLEGKVAIIVDGSPHVLIAPAVFTQFYHSPEDFYERFLIATLVRFIRAISMTMALLLPSFYIAFSSFHPEMIPSKLVIAMAAGRATVPFPSVVEAFSMEVSIEILREASVRLPGPIGPTIGIVGALIVGEAAVRAGIVSPIMVIIVALTTIGSFAAPSYNAAIALRMLRFPLMLLAAVFGLYGIMLFMILIILHLCSLKSFGVPYVAPFSPGNLLGMGDSIIRIPIYRMKNRLNVFVPSKAARKRMDPTSAEDVKPNDRTDQEEQGPQPQPE